MTNNQVLFTVGTVAKVLSVTPACIRRWIFDRKITTVKLGRLVRIPSDEVQRLIQSGLRPTQEQMRSTDSESEVSNGKE